MHIIIYTMYGFVKQQFLHDHFTFFAIRPVLDIEFFMHKSRSNYENKAETFSFQFAFFLPCIAYACSLMLVAVIMSMLMSHTSLHFFVLSFVLACACAKQT